MEIDASWSALHGATKGRNAGMALRCPTALPIAASPAARYTVQRSFRSRERRTTAMDSLDIRLPHNHHVVVSRFVAACQADERVVAAFLGGSYARGTADFYSDLDLGLITTDVAYEDFQAGRAVFIRLLG